LAKRYIREQGSTWVMSWIIPSADNLTIVSALTNIELFSALARREREGIIPSNLTPLVRNDVLYHFETEYLVIDLDSSVMVKARDLTTLYPLRTLDAIQLACAIYAKNNLNLPVTFIGADTHLLSAAAAEGFATDNPNLHL
jgi:hypothetical protein